MFGFRKKTTESEPPMQQEATSAHHQETAQTTANTNQPPPKEDKKGFFSLFSTKPTQLQPVEIDNESIENQPPEVELTPEVPQPEKKGLFARLKAGLERTRHGLTEGLAQLVLGKKEIDDDLLEELEMLLLQADVGIEATTEMIKDLTHRISRHQLADADALFQALHEDMTAMLEPVAKPLEIPPHLGKPFVIMMVGINGAGKTTTIGKLAKKFQREGKSVLLAAGDTFRAAAVEQLQVWGSRNNVQVIAQTGKADSAAVLFDALNAATARGVDVVLADTAGRLHTQDNLMEELKKVRRVLGKIDPDAPHEVMLVLDATTGQNALNQAKEFHQAVAVSGITVTKLDGTAKGGILFALAKRLALPIRYIGVGEKIDDLRPFESQSFVRALLSREKE